MAEAGILGPDDRVELIEGEIVEMPPISPEHASIVDRLLSVFSDLVRGCAILRVQNPLRLDDASEPQPDLMLLKPRSDFYKEGHPHPQDVILLIEVAHTSAAYDREVKLPIYARAGVAEVWIIDVNTARLETYTKPAATGYDAKETLQRGDEIGPAGLPEVRLNVNDLLGE